jgi:DNA repair photolyase
MHDFPVCIQTKSSLVLRDIDLLKKFSDLEVGITLTTHDDSVREKLEPGASSVEERLHALGELSKNGIKTWVFMGPMMPYLTDVEAMIGVISMAKPGYVLVDKLRTKECVRDSISGFIKEFYPHLSEKYENIFSGEENYFVKILENIKKSCENKALKFKINTL